MTDDQSAEDVLQDALLRALRAYPRLRHADHLRAWLYRVTTTTALDLHRRRRREVPTDEPPALAVEAEYDDGAFESLIAPLAPTARDALRLRFVEDLDYDRIAAVLGTSPEAARASASPPPSEPCESESPHDPPVRAVPRPPGLRRRAGGPRRRRLHDAQAPRSARCSSSRASAACCGSPSRASPRTPRWPASRAGVGPRHRALRPRAGRHPRHALGLPRGRRRHAGAAGRPRRWPAGRSAAPCSTRCTARSTAARSSPTASSRTGRQPARGARGRHRLRDEPGPDRRTLPPRAAGLPQARQLRRRARAQARPADARRRALEGLSRYALAAAPARGAARRSSPPRSAPCRSACSAWRSCCSARETTGSFAYAGRVVAAFGSPTRSARSPRGG